MNFMFHRKSQSAMEYLMTYGWAILIIAVVLSGLYSLGLFNSATLAPKASPGACEVYRPDGPLSIQYISLEGSCENRLPGYVAQFEGTGSSISIPSNPSLLSDGSFTVSEWVRFPDENAQWMPISRGGGYAGDYYLWRSGVGLGHVSLTLYDSGGNGQEVDSSSGMQADKWYFLTATYNASTATDDVYINGVLSGTENPVSLGTSTFPNITIGNKGGGPPYFNGTIANVQLYNNSMDASSVRALYEEGIGGAPINLQTLLGWWPLNDNTKDYSGNGNNGAPTKILFIQQWYNGYSVQAIPGAATTTATTTVGGTTTIPILTSLVAQFDGSTSHIATPTVAFPTGHAARSVFAWVYYTGGSGLWQEVQCYGYASTDDASCLGIYNGAVAFSSDNNDVLSSLAISQNVWHLVGYTYDGGTTVTVYLDGQAYTGTVSQLQTIEVTGSGDPSDIGTGTAGGGYFQGAMADVQIYNHALSSGLVQVMYNAGVDAGTFTPQYLVARWPLAGNANDNSGNGNNGVPTNITYVSP
jgi:hypothetical protein